MRRSAILIIVVGCGGGGAGDDQSEFAVAQHQPVDDAIAVSPTGTVEVTFTHEADPATIDAATFRVTRDGEPVAGAIAYDPDTRTATFVPDVRAPLLIGCEVAVGRDIQDLDGTPLPDDVLWTFEIRDGAWGAGAGLTTGMFTDAPEPHVGVDAYGNAVAVWSQRTGIDPDFYENVWAASYVADVGWSPAVLLEHDEVLSARHPRVSVDPLGAAVAVWEQYDGGNISIWASSYQPDTGWAEEKPIETDAAEATQPDVAIDAAGNAWVVWVQGAAIRVARYDASAGWQSASDVRPATLDWVEGPHVAVGANGEAVVTWPVWPYQQSHSSVEASYHDGAGGWAVPVLIEEVSGSDSLGPRAAVDDHGDAVVAWQKYLGISSTIRVNRYVHGTGWGSAEDLDDGSGETAWTPAVATAPSGEAIVVWQRGFWIEASLFDGTAWSAAAPISDEGNGQSPQVAVDPGGNAVVAWADRSTVLSSRYVPGEGWTPIEILALPQSDYQEATEIAVGADGTGVVIWEYVGGQSTVTEVWASAWR